MPTHAAQSVMDPARARRVELILRQIDFLPTLPAVAARLLALTLDEQSDASQIAQVIRADPAMTSRILSICRRADLGMQQNTLTIEKAVVLLGYTAIRSAVLSIKVYELFTTPRPGSPISPTDDAGFDDSNSSSAAGTATAELDRPAFWRHCLGVAIAAEQIARAHPELGCNPGEAFVCGLLHDMGKLALDYILPKSFGRVIELVELNQGNIADFERRILGIDHHTAGKRLAEQWNLPHLIQDCIWLHGSPIEMLPSLEHRNMIAVVSLADQIVRRNHLGYSGNFVFVHETDSVCAALGLKTDQIEEIAGRLHALLEECSRELGIEEQAPHSLLLQSIQQANQALGRLNEVLERRGRQSTRQAQALEAIAAFHASALPGRNVEDVLAAAVASAMSALGAGFFAMVCPVGADNHWLVCQYNDQGRTVFSQIIKPPSACPDLSRIDAAQPASLNLMGIVPWLADYLADAPDLRQVRVLPLGCGWGTAALLVHDRSSLPPSQQLSALCSTWGAAIAAAGQHDGARRLGEELAQANRALAETQDRLLQSESLARVGEMTAGAAHEMNNPLTVICGRAQLLVHWLQPGSKEQIAAQTISDQAQRLSDLISMMHLFARPPQLKLRPVELLAILDQAVKKATGEMEAERRDKPLEVSVSVDQSPLMLSADAPQLIEGLSELVLNAMQSQPRSIVRVHGKIDNTGRAAIVDFIDDGIGMDQHTLSHAFDPFFSNRPAGRRIGMGLCRVQLLIGAHHGRIVLRSTPDKGTTAIVVLPLDSAS